MALYQTLPVYRDTYRMLLTLFRLTGHFPREYKYTLGQDLKRDAMRLVRHIFRANAEAGRRGEHLRSFADDFELVRLQVRLGFDLKLVSHRQFADITEQMDTIGRQITGWRRAAP